MSHREVLTMMGRKAALLAVYASFAVSSTFCCGASAFAAARPSVGDETNALIFAGRYPAALASARAQLAAMRAAGDAAGAADAATKLGEVYLLLDDDVHADPLTRGAAAYDERHARSGPLADALTLVARGDLDRFEWRAAEQNAARAVSLYDRLGDGATLLAVPALGALDAAELELGRRDPATKAYVRAVGILGGIPPKRRASARVRFTIDRFLQDDLPDLERRRPQHWEDALRERIARHADSNVAARIDRYAELADVESTTHDDGAERDARTALLLARRALGPDSVTVALREEALAGVASSGGTPEIRRLLEHARNVVEKNLGPEHPRTIEMGVFLESAFLAANDRARARRTIDSMWRSYARGLADDDSRLAELSFGYGIYYRDAGDSGRARIWFEREIAVVRRAIQGENDEVGYAELQIAKSLGYAGYVAEAAQAADVAIATYEAVDGNASQPLCDALDVRGDVFAAQNRLDDAYGDRLQVVARMTHLYGATSVRLARPLSTLERTARDDGKIGSLESLLRWLLVIDADRFPGGFIRPLPKDVRAVRAAGQTTFPVFETVHGGSLPFVVDRTGNAGDVLAGIAGLFLIDGNLSGRFAETARRGRALAAALQHDPSRGRRAALVTVLTGLADNDWRSGDTKKALHDVDLAIGLSRADGSPDSLERETLVAGRTEFELELGMLAPADRDAREWARLDARNGYARDTMAVAGAGSGAVLHEGIIAMVRDRPFEARADFRRLLSTEEPDFANALLNASESEATAYIEGSRGYEATLAFYARFSNRNRTWAGEMYDLVLREKGLVAKSTASVRRVIDRSYGHEATALLDRLREARARYAAEKLLEPADPREHGVWADRLSALAREETDDQERLTTRVARLPNIDDVMFDRVSWRDVAAKLGPGDAAIEIVVTDPVVRNGIDTSHRRFDALVLKNDRLPPQLVALGDEPTIAGEAIDAYRQSVRSDGRDRHAYTQTLANEVWIPLEPYLHGITRVYLAPDGALDEVNFDALDLGGGRLLGDAIDVRTVTSTGDLAAKRKAPDRSNRAALVIGNPRYDLDERTQAAALNDTDVPPRAAPVIADAGLLRDPPPRGAALTPLDRTQSEADDVSAQLRSSGYDVREFTGAGAQRTIVERLAPHARIVHVATHAFVLPGNGTDLTREGLLFAGADRYWASGARSTTADDGVLTALEATALDLTGTDLVVLSACGTGTGSLSGSEGVFGLARAFREAGAGATLVSLWDVPDDDTATLMQNFYRLWLAGADKHEALREAEQIVRAEVIRDYGYDIPWRWAGFTVVGI